MDTTQSVVEKSAINTVAIRLVPFGGLMLLSSILMVTLSRRGTASEGTPAEALDPSGAGHHSKP